MRRLIPWLPVFFCFVFFNCDSKNKNPSTFYFMINILVISMNLGQNTAAGLPRKQFYITIKNTLTKTDSILGTFTNTGQDLPLLSNQSQFFMT